MKNRKYTYSIIMGTGGKDSTMYLETYGPCNSFAEAIGSAILNELEVAQNTDEKAKTSDSMFKLEAIDSVDLFDEHDNPIPECYVLYTINSDAEDWVKVGYINPMLEY